jgi:RNA polymerase sigma-70 factor (ECF subfamily)
MTTNTSDSTSSSLLMQVKNKDPDAWRRFADLYGPMVYQWCRQAGLTEPDVADVGQNVFAAVFRNIHGLRLDGPKDSLRGWLWRITRNEVVTLHRQRAKQPRAAGGTDAQQAIQQLPDFFSSDDTPPSSGTQHHLLRRAVQLIENEFELHTWRAFWRTAIDGQSAPEVADELEMTPGAVRLAKHRVLKRLRDFMTED